MPNIWFERPLPAEFAQLLHGVAEPTGAAADPTNSFATLSEADGVVAGGSVHYNGEFMAQAPRLKVIARTGIGIDNVDVEAATARGIAVCNTPDGPTISTAEHTITLMFAVAKRLKWFDQTLQRETRPNYFLAYNGLELFEKSVGVVGLGRIGGRVAQLCAALGMNVIGYDPYAPAARTSELGIQRASTLDELLSTIDVLTLHLPRTKETANLIDAQRLAQLKPGAIVINAARGGILDEDALLDALERGHLRGAGLDVFEIEPPAADHPLLQRDDVIATPHVASGTISGKKRMWHGAIEQVIQVLRNERPSYLVNPTVWPNNT